MQINLTGFLNGSKAREFMGELWTLLYSAQTSKTGVPAELLLAKAQDIMQRVRLPHVFAHLRVADTVHRHSYDNRRQRKRIRRL